MTNAQEPMGTWVDQVWTQHHDHLSCVTLGKKLVFLSLTLLIYKNDHLIKLFLKPL